MKKKLNKGDLKQLKKYCIFVLIIFSNSSSSTFYISVCVYDLRIVLLERNCKIN